MTSVRREGLEGLTREIIECHRCPRLVEWRERVAREKRAAFRDESYWGRPIPGWGDPEARLLVVGLAPAAHGGNRTGRIFTGDRSGDWLFQAMWETGFANQPTSVSRDDGLELRDAYVLATVRCAPPANKPTIEERDTCEPFLRREWALLDRLQVVVALGQYAYSAVSRISRPVERTRFGHGVETELADGRLLICSYHPSQQNTFTGRLTRDMLRGVFERAQEVIAEGER